MSNLLQMQRCLSPGSRLAILRVTTGVCLVHVSRVDNGRPNAVVIPLSVDNVGN